MAWRHCHALTGDVAGFDEATAAVEERMAALPRHPAECHADDAGAWRLVIAALAATPARESLLRDWLASPFAEPEHHPSRAKLEGLWEQCRRATPPDADRPAR